MRDTVQKLKREVSRLRKENRILREELGNIMKPARPRKEHKEEPSPKKMTMEEWRANFIKEFKPKIKKRSGALK